MHRPCSEPAVAESFDPIGSAIAVDEFEEATLFPVGCLILVEEGETAVLEGLEKLFPGDRLQLVVWLREVNAKDALAVVAFGSFHLGRSAAALLDPALKSSLARWWSRPGPWPASPAVAHRRCGRAEAER